MEKTKTLVVYKIHHEVRRKDFNVENLKIHIEHILETPKQREIGDFKSRGRE